MKSTKYGYKPQLRIPIYSRNKIKNITQKDRFNIKFSYLLTKIPSDQISFMTLWIEYNFDEYTKLVGHNDLNELTLFEWNILVNHINSLTNINIL